MSELLSILIPIHERDHVKYSRLSDSLYYQIGYGKHDVVELYPYLNKGKFSKGHYRNELLSWAKGEYVCFVDADDRVSKNYIETLLEGIKTKPDCISLRGIFTEDNGLPYVFEHSLKYTAWKTNNYEQGLKYINHLEHIKYERNPNHLNCIKSEIAKQIKFPEINHGEDHKWSDLLFNTGLLKNEYYTDRILYYYDYISSK